jgi:ribonuclease HII
MPRRPSVCESGEHPELFGPRSAEGCGELEGWAAARGWRVVVGVDEVGRGPLAGPVVAAAVALRVDQLIPGLNDSKKLSAAQRERLDGAVRQEALGFGLGRVEPARIDELNIRRAALEAMSLAFAELLRSLAVRNAAGAEKSDLVLLDGVLVDGLDVFPWPAGAPALPVKAFVRGDGRSRAIAAASIVAKVHRDALMREYHARWPMYGFDQHMGYPTAAHQAALREHGPCEIHRRSFRGVLPDEG